MLPFIVSRRTHVPSCGPACWSVAISDRGVVCGAGSLLTRIAEEPGSAKPSLDTDRLVAMLSVVAGEVLPAATILPPIQAAVAHWRRGDKALANLRLIFARLPRPTDPAAVERVKQAECLLNDGLAPTNLMKALWPLQFARRYDPNEPRVPAGNPDGGRWTFADATAGVRPKRILVAEADDDPAEGFEPPWPRHDQVEHDATANPHVAGHHPIQPLDPLTGLPGGASRTSRSNAIEKAARDALATVGPGKGPVHGTAVHSQFKSNIDALGDPELQTEQSYRNGVHVKYGTKGSIRIDVVEGPVLTPSIGHDLKTGGASLPPARFRQLQMHVTGGYKIPFREHKP